MTKEYKEFKNKLNRDNHHEILLKASEILNPYELDCLIGDILKIINTIQLTLNFECHEPNASTKRNAIH